MKRRARGLTLIELMVTLAVAIVLLAIGIPAFNTLTARDISATTVNGLVTALQQARMEAISRGQPVAVVSSNWKDGWSVQAEDDAGTVQDLRVFTAPRAAQIKIEGVASPVTFSTSPIRFSSRGGVPANAKFTVSAYKTSDTTATPVRVRFVCVTRVGQVRTTDVESECP